MKRTYIDLLFIITAAVVLVLTCDAITAHKQIRSIADNDAVGYTTAARSLAQTGKIVCHIIYPSTLAQPATKTWLYMPGMYYLLAGAYKLFGFGVNQSLAVSGGCFVIAAVCTNLISLRFTDRFTSLMAAGFFMIYPANLYFSATAMTELALVAAAALAFCIFVYLPRRTAIFVGPFLCLMPFMFRETGAFISLPMAIVLLLDSQDGGIPWRRNFWRAAMLLVLSVAVLTLVYISPVGSGRPSLVKLDIFIKESRAEHIYRDALAGDHIKATLGDWCSVVMTRFGVNARELWRRAFAQKYTSDLMLLPLLTAVPLGIFWYLHKRDVLAICAAALLLLTLCFVCMFYTARMDRPVRVAMFAFPLVAILHAQLAVAFFGWIAAKLPAEHRAWPAAIGIVLAVSWAVHACFKGFADMRDWDVAEERASEFVQELRPDPDAMIVGPHLLCVPYINRHFPATFSFVPANRQTLALLCSKYRVGMVIYNPQDALDLSIFDIVEEGFLPYRRFHLNDPMHLEGKYLVFRRPDFWGEEGDWNPDSKEEFNWVPKRRSN